MKNVFVEASLNHLPIMGNFYKHNKKTQTGLNQKSAETFKLTNSL